MSNHRKTSDEWSESYLEKQPWVKLYKARVREVMTHPKLNQASRLTYFALIPDFDDGAGHLIGDLRVICARLALDESKVTDHLERLEKAGFLGCENGVYYDTLLAKRAGKKAANPAEFSQISPNPKVNIQNSDICPRENGNEMSALDKIRASSLDASNAASKERSDSLSIKNEEDRKNREGSLGVASRFSALKIEVIEEVRCANPSLDWLDLCAKFISANEKTPSSRINRKWFETFVAGYAKRQGVATVSAGPASREDERVRIARLPKLDCHFEEDKEFEQYTTTVWTIGDKPITQKNFGIEQSDFLRFVKTMTPRSKEKAHKFLCSLIGGKEWNTQDAYDAYDQLFGATDSGDWCGADYESDEGKAARLERERVDREEKARAAQAAKEAQEAEELARKQADQIRKEREEAERQEREKAEAERKRQEGEERAKREAAEREEREKEEAAFNEKFASVLSLVSDEYSRERLAHAIQNESLWAKMKPDGAKDRFRIRIRLKVGDELTEKVIATIEANNLHWWNPADERKQIAAKHVNALLEKTVENGCTKGEAASAAAKAQELKAKYGIGLSKLVQKETDEATIS